MGKVYSRKRTQKRKNRSKLLKRTLKRRNSFRKKNTYKRRKSFRKKQSVRIKGSGFTSQHCPSKIIRFTHSEEHNKKAPYISQVIDLGESDIKRSLREEHPDGRFGATDWRSETLKQIPNALKKGSKTLYSKTLYKVIITSDMKRVIDEVYTKRVESLEKDNIDIWRFLRKHRTHLETKPWNEAQQGLYVFKSFSDFNELKDLIIRNDDYIFGHRRWGGDINWTDSKIRIKLTDDDCKERVDRINDLLHYTHSILRYISRKGKPEDLDSHSYHSIQEILGYMMIKIILFFFPSTNTTG